MFGYFVLYFSTLCSHSLRLLEFLDFVLVLLGTYFLPSSYFPASLSSIKVGLEWLITSETKMFLNCPVDIRYTNLSLSLAFEQFPRLKSCQSILLVTCISLSPAVHCVALFVSEFWL